MAISKDEEFNILVTKVLKNEGGYSRDKNDPGGETKYGISKKVYPSLDIKNITAAQAKKIYYRDYYSPYKLQDIKDLNMRYKVFDMCVLMGTFYPLKFYKQVLLLSPDNPVEMFKNLCKDRFNMLIEKNPKLEVFRTNWFHRINNKLDTNG